MEEIEETISIIEKSVSNIVSKVKLMIENIKSVNKTSHSMFLVSIFMISYEDEKKFINKYDYYLYLFNTLLSFFRVEELNAYNKDLFDVFAELLYETIGRKIITQKVEICYDVLNIELFHLLFKSTHINMLLYSTPEEHKDFFDLIEKEFHIYMNNLYGVIFRSSLSKEESIMIHLDYILRNEYSIYSLDYIFFEELHEFMVVEYDEPPINNNNNNIFNIIYQNQDNVEGGNNEFDEEDDIYS
jgi:hypothetical protein